MFNLTTTETLSGALRTEIRSLLDTAFEGDFSDDDWNHALGGVHVWLTVDARVISHASVVERSLVCDGRRLRVGYVEAVATLPEYQRKGYGTIVMQQAGELIRGGFDVGALSTGTPQFYERFGWERWLGPTFVDAPDGRQRTADDDGGIMILRTPRSPNLALHGEIICDWRAGDVW